MLYFHEVILYLIASVNVFGDYCWNEGVLLNGNQVLLALKSDVEDRGTKGDRTPLMEASCGGYLDIVRLLLAHKANVNAQAPSGNYLVIIEEID